MKAFSIVFIGDGKAIHIKPKTKHIFKGDKGYKEGSVCINGVTHDNMLFSIEDIEKYKNLPNTVVHSV